MLWQHDPAQPIGVWDEVREDATGLWVKGRILTEVEQGREAAALLAAGAIDGLSIGYRTVRAERDGKGQRLLAGAGALGGVAGDLPDASRGAGRGQGAMRLDERLARRGGGLRGRAPQIWPGAERGVSLRNEKDDEMTETKARAGEGMSPAHAPAAEAKAAMTGFPERIQRLSGRSEIQRCNNRKSD